MKRQSTISAFFSKKPAKKQKETHETPVEEHSVPPDLPVKDVPIKDVVMQDVSEDLAVAARRKLFIQRFGEESSTKKQKVQDVPKDYTPLEKQVVELKARHPGILLLIEVGYKFRFFGEDAKVTC
jgi:DNA mismatch repair protein MSH3